MSVGNKFNHLKLSPFAKSKMNIFDNSEKAKIFFFKFEQFYAFRLNSFHKK